MPCILAPMEWFPVMIERADFRMTRRYLTRELVTSRYKKTVLFVIDADQINGRIIKSKNFFSLRGKYSDQDVLRMHEATTSGKIKPDEISYILTPSEYAGLAQRYFPENKIISVGTVDVNLDMELLNDDVFVQLGWVQGRVPDYASALRKIMSAHKAPLYCHGVRLEPFDLTEKPAAVWPNISSTGVSAIAESK